MENKRFQEENKTNQIEDQNSINEKNNIPYQNGNQENRKFNEQDNKNKCIETCLIDENTNNINSNTNTLQIKNEKQKNNNTFIDINSMSDENTINENSFENIMKINQDYLNKCEYSKRYGNRQDGNFEQKQNKENNLINSQENKNIDNEGISPCKQNEINNNIKQEEYDNNYSINLPLFTEVIKVGSKSIFYPDHSNRYPLKATGKQQMTKNEIKTTNENVLQTNLEKSKQEDKSDDNYFKIQCNNEEKRDVNNFQQNIQSTEIKTINDNHMLFQINDTQDKTKTKNVNEKKFEALPLLAEEIKKCSKLVFYPDHSNRYNKNELSY